MQCPACRATNTSTARFCASCGAQLPAAPEATRLAGTATLPAVPPPAGRKQSGFGKGCLQVLFVVISIGIITSVISQCSHPAQDQTASAPSQQNEATDQPTDPPTTSPFLANGSAIGGLRYTITDVSRQSSVESFGEDKSASGEFLVVRLKVANVGSKAADVSGGDFHLKRGDTEFDEDSNVTVDGEFFLEKLNPGVSKSGVLVFDVPSATAETTYALEVYGNGSEGSQESGLIRL